jgi:hypothetical protein
MASPRVRRVLPAVFLVCAVFAVPRTSRAQDVPGGAHGVGLGVGVGVAAPFGKIITPSGIESLKPNFDWGFYVDIPLAYGFHLTPHAELYNVNQKLSATDLGLAFKFIIETPRVRPYFGIDVGDTNLDSAQQINVGGLVGLNIVLIANLDFFVEGRYIEIVRGAEVGGNVGTVHAFGGLLIRF